MLLKVLVVTKKRVYRWNRIRIYSLPFAAIVLEPITDGFVSGIFVAWCCHILGFDPFAVFLWHSLTWFTLEYIFLAVLEVSCINISNANIVSLIASQCTMHGSGVLQRNNLSGQVACLPAGSP